MSSCWLSRRWGHGTSRCRLVRRSLASWRLPRDGSSLAALPILPTPALAVCPSAPSSREWGRMSPSDPQNALGARTICSPQGVDAVDWPGSSSSVAPVTSGLKRQAAKSWRSLQQLHTAVCPRHIAGCYSLREGSVMQVKPRWVRPYLALTVFVTYRTSFFI